MDCDDTLKQLTALHDGEIDGTLDASANRSATDHLAGCATCRTALTELQSLRAFIRRHGRSAPPADLLHRIEEGTSQTTPTPGSLSAWLVPRLVAAGLGALCIGGAWWFSSSDHPHSGPEVSTPVARYLRASTVSATLDELHQLERRPESRILAWARMEAKKR